MPVQPDIAERHLIALWTAIREASDAAESGEAGAWSAPELAPLRLALAASARRLSSALERPVTAAVAPQVPAERPRVLVVDDEEMAAMALGALLEESFEVTATTQPEEVARLVRENRIEAVVTDLRMPGLDGLALLELLRRAPAGAAPAVLVMSANDEPHNRIAALSRGAFDFVAKPIDLPELEARLRRAVQYARDLGREHALQQSDALTGLYNRRGLVARLAEALDDRRRGPLAVAMIDQDGLKAVNDRYGHGAGDQAIQRVAAAIKATQRTSDISARFGGDEFALVMPDTSAEGAERTLRRVERALGATPLELGAERVTVCISWGIAVADPGSGRDAADALLAAADAALYRMKRNKRAAAAG